MVGDYLSSQSPLESSEFDITGEVRRSMVLLIEQFTQVDSPKKSNDVQIVAVNIADRYLSFRKDQGLAAPSLIELAIVALVLATKVEAPTLRPHYRDYIEVVNTWNIKEIKKEHLLSLEMKVLTGLEFRLVLPSSQAYLLDRFMHVIGHEQGWVESTRLQIRKKAEEICTQVYRESEFLKYRTSQIAAAATLAAIKDLFPQLLLKLQQLVWTPHAESLLKIEFCRDVNEPYR